MAFSKYANAAVVQPVVSMTAWDEVRSRSLALGTAFSQREAQSKLLFQKYDPQQYMLSHCTIIASVDTENGPGPLGRQMDGFTPIDRRFSDYYITPSTSQYVNSNQDAWERKLLLSTFRTFVGGQNYVEHLQIPELSKGRIVDAAARDIGGSIYVDILVATERKHGPLITAVESGQLSTLSMGCFLAGTQVSLSDGRRIPIEEVTPGEMVLTHKGRSREVLNKQIRIGIWGMRQIEVVGIPSVITSTDNHPFFVLRTPVTCACGCGSTLKRDDRDPVRRIGKRFKIGHQLRVYNPNAPYSLDEARNRRQRLRDLQKPVLMEVRADELCEGDFLCFPRGSERAETPGASEGKAKLLGFFLAEGSFLKHKGETIEVQFNFSMEEKETYAKEVVALLRQEFPESNSPWIQERPERNTCVVHVTGGGVPNWFKTHGGEYSHLKRISSEVMAWPTDMLAYLVGAWVDGDGTYGKANKTLSGTTTSYDLICQMHVLMSRLGIFARLSCMYEGVSSYMQEAVNGGTASRGSNGKLASFTLSIPRSFSYKVSSSKAPALGADTPNKNLRVLDDYVVFPITSIKAVAYEGPVYDLEVEEDHSYLVEGVAVHNCSVSHTTCTKCGNVAEDETQLCQHIKYAKGNTFIDHLGKQRKIAELCGHATDPKSVKFIEASWVANPAFKGAVVRNILTPEEKALLGPRLNTAFSMPSPVADPNQRAKAARIAQGEQGQGFDFGEGGEFENTPKEAPSQEDPLQKAVDDLTNVMKEKALEKVRKEITQQELSPRADHEENKNNNLVKEAAKSPEWRAIAKVVLSQVKDSELTRRILTGLLLFKSGGWQSVKGYNSFSGREVLAISRFLDEFQGSRIAGEPKLYRTVLAVGGMAPYGDLDSYLAACRRNLGRELTASEQDTLITKGRLYDLGVS